MEKRRITPLRFVIAVLVLVLCAAWLWFAISQWNSARYFRSNISAGYVDSFLGSMDSVGRFAAQIYLNLAPFLFFAFYVTVLVPDVIKQFLKEWSGKPRLIYRVIAFLLTAAAALCMLADCTSLHELIWRHRGLRLNAFLNSMRGIYAALTPVSLLLIGTTWLLPRMGKGLLDGVRAPKTIGPHLKRTLLSILLCVAISFCSTALSASMLTVLNAFSRSAVATVTNFCRRNASYLSMCVVSILLAPVIEEVAFRGLIQGHLRKAGYPFWPALLLTAVCFGLWHRNLGQFVYTFAFALVTGYVYEHGVSLFYPMLIHFCNNLFSVLAYSDSSGALFGELFILPAIRKFLMDCSPFLAGAIFVLLAFGIVILLRIFARIRCAGKESDPKQ